MAKGRVEDLLSMAQRAGKVASGDFAVRKALAEGQAVLLLIAANAAEDTKEEYERLAQRYQVKMQPCLTKESLGHCLGKEYRAVAVLLDRGFSEALEKRIQSG